MAHKKVVFIHGNQTLHWSYAWVPWMVTELRKLNIEVVAETMPDSIIARQKYWITFLEDVAKVDDQTILVGHSSGALCAMRYAENHTILGSVLIGAAYQHHEDSLEIQSGYYDAPWEWDQIKKNQQWIVQFASVDDPYIPIKDMRHVQQRLATEYHEYTDRGHFFENQNEFPELLDSIKKKIVLTS
jgi:predicted alpha/beta hydrolase family esterase